MRWWAKSALAVVGVALVLAASALRDARIRLYVEPTYEQDKLQRLLVGYPDLRVVLLPGTEDVALRVKAIPQPASIRTLRAAVRAHARRTGYEVYAVAELLPRKSHEVLRARWVNSYGPGIFEDAFSDLLHQVVVEAARASHKHFQRTPEEVERAAAAIESSPSP
ncbi:MAG: hypothetical protein ACE5H2_00860 [Terriglobia bacterium]